jgi:ParB family chromosome partitioning protein
MKLESIKQKEDIKNRRFVMLIDINKIKVTDRIRKDFGNIEELANDIKENGLINPPVVTPEYELIAGERRLRALKFLNYQQIEVRAMSVNDCEHQLKLEISENENRKDFSFSERIDYAKRLELVEKLKAKNRQELGVKETFPEGQKVGQVRDIVAESTGFGSGKQYDKAKYISENADEEMIKSLDEGKLSINKAYLNLKQQKESLEKQLQIEHNKKPKTIDNTDYDTINELKSQLSQKDKSIEILKRDKDLLERKAQLNEEEAKEYNDFKKRMEELTNEQNDIRRKINAATSLSSLVVEINYLIETKLAPVKYVNDLFIMQNDEIFMENLSEIINKVRNWYQEISSYLPNKNIITVEAIHHE